MAGGATVYQHIKDALMQGRLPQRVSDFHMGSIVQYFVDVKGDMRAVRDQSFQMFYRGHVQSVEISDNCTAQKTLTRSTVLPSMRTGAYKVLVIIDKDSNIEQANCSCPSGQGPRASCKHIAAHSYAIEEFSRLFTRGEMDLARTEQLSQWNRPRAKKIACVPTYELPFEKQKHGHTQKERKGKHPSSYQLNDICESDIKAAKKLISDLKDFEVKTKTKVGCLQVLDPVNPIAPVNAQVPVGSFIDKMNSDIEKIARSEKSREEKVTEVMNALKVSAEDRDRMEEETRGQAAVALWMRAREKRIRASICYRAISFQYRTPSAGQGLVKDILRPTQFSTADVQFGIDNEDAAIKKYEDSRNVTVEKCGMFISLEKGYLSATPDSIIIEPSGEKGLLEVKALPTFSKVLPVNAYMDNKYPVKMTRVVVNGVTQRVPKLKKNHKYYHQVQLQLYCCSHFATFADFGIFHKEVDQIHVERIFRDDVWVATNIPKMEAFYTSKVMDVLLM